ncbi:MAG TPA: SpaA isopeptide-forming pilin-related protein, partial [Saprospiraceae bacterium]|nr:SpaA isopeptide-forming pilin-related protein [Saprospiraceae bacterium]
PGSYVIVETQPVSWNTADDYDSTDDGDLVANISGLDNLIPTTLLANEIDSNNYFIETAQPGSITGNVFDDANGNLTPDSGEGLGGATLKLYADANADGIADNSTALNTQTTGSSGTFTMSGISVGNYVIVETNPVGYVSLKDFDPTTDNDVVTNTNMNNDTLPVTVSNAENDANNYFIDAITCPRMVLNTLDAGYASLRYNLDCVQEGDTIRFLASLAGQTIFITSTVLNITKNVVLNSTLSPKLTVASNIQQLFVIQPNKSLEVISLRIISGNPPSNIGAAFDNSGTLILHDVNVLKNSLFSTGQYLIRNMPGSSCTFSGNCTIDND